MLKGVVVVLLIGLLSWAYQTILPPPPKLCGSPGGPPVTAPRIKLRDGRYLAYKEHGEAKETANYKIIVVHGFSSCRHDVSMATLDVVKELGVYLASFDRPGYGESDPDPKRTKKSLALDIEELADQLGLGSKFYVIGFSMGGQAVWGCLKYIPRRSFWTEMTDELFQDVIKELGVYLVSFDRPGYGESDPDPKRTKKSLALDIEELADELGLGFKFYVIGFSMGGQAVWGCLKHIPHRLKGAALLAPVINYWWPGFPANLSKQAYEEQYLQDQWALRVSHYVPWLTYWWNTQNWFPPSSVVAGKLKLSRQDLELSPKLAGRQNFRAYVTQQGVFESKLRDMIVGFGSWEFDPMDLQNPLVDGEVASVHLWQGDEDGLVPVTLQRYIAGKLPWIEYHEVPGAGHLFPHSEQMGEAILRTLLLGEKWPNK